MDVERVEEIEEDFENFVRTKLDHCEGRNLPANFVPYTELWMIDTHYAEEQATVVGRISLRHQLNEALTTFGGHIGYEVRPSARRKGYATKALALMLEHAKAQGLENVMLTCADDNVASIKVIEANGGALIDKLKSEHRPVETRRYRIKL